ncbi:Predicted ester cyclase [Methylobacterium pseudosasicola]|uniref:Predicted ester cyclase n=2 Tax=Methylobacterium pseudosasicola TaxID=582667 RepID=A0A1I4SKD9_9HYPH|nr:Predicted ester cyclase [Methylobacterium pseudosasicola]
MRIAPAILSLLALSTPALAAQVDDRAAVALAKPQELIVDTGLHAATVAAMLTPVDAFYGFWTNGSQTPLDQAIGPNVTDRTPPPGRRPGPSGPAAAGKAFLAAVPDLTVMVVQRIVAGDRVVSHLRFTGHFTDRFSGVEGKGQAIEFIATDILRVAGGRITDNRHLEDNLTFLRQAGLLPKAGD